MNAGFQTHGYSHNRAYSGSLNHRDRHASEIDRGNDGKLSATKLQDARPGQRTSVESINRMGLDALGKLEVAAVARSDTQKDATPSMVESLTIANFADYLAERVDPAKQAEDIANGVISRLDRDGSEGLNSEEIAGSRLAEDIGAGFYEVDADKNGTLDTAELSDFIAREYLRGQQVEATPAQSESSFDVGEDESLSAVAMDAAQVDMSETEAASEAAIIDEVDQNSEIVSSPFTPEKSYEDQILASLEAALEMLREGSDQRPTLDVVQNLYSEVKDIFARVNS